MILKDGTEEKTHAELNRYYAGEWRNVMEHIKFRRIILSNKGCVGIAIFQPTDEKNRDPTVHSGGISHRIGTPLR